MQPNTSGYYQHYSREITRALDGLLTTQSRGGVLDSEDAFVRWLAMTRTVQETGCTLYFTGNGASAAMAGHMAADATKNGRVRAMAFNEVSLLTAVSNDIAFAECFAEPLRRFGQAGDLLVTISSSGNSKNILQAIAAARELGIGVITLSGMDATNHSRALGDLNFYVPARTYGIVECAHQVLLHCWLDRFMGIEAWGACPQVVD